MKTIPNNPNRPLGEQLDELVRRKRAAGKESTACLYRAAANHLIVYLKDRVERAHDLTAAHVEGFAYYLDRQAGLRRNSINAYLAAIRAMYNRLRDEASLNLPPRRDPYLRAGNPFRRLDLRAESTRKRALRPSELRRLVSLPEDTPADLRVVADLFLFAYLGCGIPFADMARLTVGNIRQDTLCYYRRKTGVAITIPLTRGMRRILARFGSQQGGLLFPILPKGSNYNAYKRKLRQFNHALKRLAAWVGMRDGSLTSYVARHSWATEAHRRHTPMAVISQALGHTSERTTRAYLDKLDISDLRKANRIVTGELESLIINP